MPQLRFVDQLLEDVLAKLPTSSIQEALDGSSDVKFVKLPPTKLPTGGWKEDWGKYLYKGKEWRLVSASDPALKGQRYFDVIGPNGKRGKNLHPFYHETPMGGVRASIASSGGNWPEKDFDAKDWV